MTKKTTPLLRLLSTCLLLCGLCTTALGQQEHHTDDESLAERVGLIEAKQDMLNVYLEMHSSLDAEWMGPDFDQLRFQVRQLRLEAQGQICSWLSFRWRQCLNRANDNRGSIDNLPTSIDVAGIGLHPSEQVSLFLGKQCVAYGGIEFDMNPIEIYEFSDIIQHMACFFTGVGLSYHPVSGQQIQLQVLNARNGSFATDYPLAAERGIADSKAPLVYTANWNGTLLPDHWTTRWSYSYMSQSAEHALHYVALGNQFFLGPVDGHLDWMYSHEGLNSKMIIDAAEDVDYNSLVLKFNYRLTDRWTLFTKGMYETASDGAGEKWFGGTKQRTALGYFGGVEYYPMADSNFRFYLTYVGRHYRYHDIAATDYTNKLLCGFIYELPML